MFKLKLLLINSERKNPFIFLFSSIYTLIFQRYFLILPLSSFSFFFFFTINACPMLAVYSPFASFSNHLV